MPQTRLRFVLVVGLLSLLSFPSFSLSQTINPDLLRESWRAQWITYPDGPQREFGVFHFRKTFRLEKIPANFVINSWRK